MAVTVSSKGSLKKYRINFFGFPYSGKTTCLGSFQDEGIIHIVNCPGEKGTESISEGENVKSYIFSYELEDSNVSLTDSFNLTKDILNSFNTVTRDIMKGAYGKVNMLAFDGLLRLQEYFLDYATEGKYLRGLEFDTRRCYPRASSLFTNFLGEIYHSNIPIVVTTTWAKYDFAEENMSETQQTQITRQGGKKLWPNLIGKMSHQILGEFNASIYCGFEMFTQCASCKVAQAKGEAIEKEEHRIWQLNPKGDVLGVGIKDSNKSKIYPTYIHQDWKILKALLNS